MEIKCNVVGKLTLVEGYDRGDGRCESRWETGGALIKRNDDVHHLLLCNAVLLHRDLSEILVMNHMRAFNNHYNPSGRSLPRKPAHCPTQCTRPLTEQFRHMRQRQQCWLGAGQRSDASRHFIIIETGAP